MNFFATIKADQGRGKQLGFPSANFDLTQNIEDGIYLGRANTLPALVFIGANVTFAENVRHGEAYLLDFSGDLYDQEMEIEILQKIRENQKFDSAEELVEQMKRDEEVAREYFKAYNLHN